MIHHAKGTISRQGGVNTPEGTYEGIRLASENQNHAAA
jgi:hypothetical protein